MEENIVNELDTEMLLEYLDKVTNELQAAGYYVKQNRKTFSFDIESRDIRIGGLVVKSKDNDKVRLIYQISTDVNHIDPSKIEKAILMVEPKEFSLLAFCLKYPNSFSDKADGIVFESMITSVDDSDIVGNLYTLIKTLSDVLKFFCDESFDGDFGHNVSIVPLKLNELYDGVIGISADFYLGQDGELLPDDEDIGEADIVDDISFDIPVDNIEICSKKPDAVKENNNRKVKSDLIGLSLE